ncbi:MAG: S41 family peptidase [Candidatus Obscuribacterales bacterium]
MRIKSRPLNLIVCLAVYAAGISSAAAQDESPELKPAVPKMDTLKERHKDPLRAGVQHNAVATPPKKKKKLKAQARDQGFRGQAGTPGLGSGGLRSSADQYDMEIQRGIGIIGVKFTSVSGYPPLIHTVFPGTPAADVGVMPDDEIVAVDGVPTAGLSREECYDLIVGTPNTPVTLSLKRRYGFVVKKLTRMDFNDIKDPAVRRAYLRGF